VSRVACRVSRVAWRVARGAWRVARGAWLVARGSCAVMHSPCIPFDHEAPSHSRRNVVCRVVTGAEALALQDALNRMHVRDRERVIAGELTAEALHFIPAEMARNSVVRWTDAAVRRLKR